MPAALLFDQHARTAGHSPVVLVVTKVVIGAAIHDLQAAIRPQACWWRKGTEETGKPPS